jgi:hypothetical protein
VTETAAVGLVVGLALAAVLCFELYAGVGSLALSGGHLLLALGIALDACSRALGTVATGRTAEPCWGWACAVGGSPAVTVFAMFGTDGPVLAEPGPLAGFVSMLAMLLIALAVLGSMLGV